MQCWVGTAFSNRLSNSRVYKNLCSVHKLDFSPNTIFFFEKHYHIDGEECKVCDGENIIDSNITVENRTLAT